MNKERLAYYVYCQNTIGKNLYLIDANIKSENHATNYYLILIEKKI